MWAALRHRLTRDSLFVVLGTTGFLHEVFLTSQERPFLLTLSAALVGFPLVLRGLELKQKPPPDDKKEDRSLADW